MQVEVSDMSNADCRGSSRRRLDRADNLNLEVNALMTQASALVNEARRLVQEALDSQGDVDSFLSGQLDDYVESIEALLRKKDAAFQKNRETLLQQVEAEEFDLERKIAAIKEQYTTLSGMIKSCHEPKKNLKFELRDLGNFGTNQLSDS